MGAGAVPAGEPIGAGVRGPDMDSSRSATALAAITALGVLVNADVHLYLWATGYRALAVVGPLFLLNVIAGAVLAVAVLAWRHWLTAFLAAGFSVATLGAFLISVTVGLFGVDETLAGGPQALAGVAEIVSIVTGLVLVVRDRTGGLRSRTDRLLAARLRSGLARR